MRYTIVFMVVLFLGSLDEMKGQSFVNGSFESWGAANNCEINVSPDGWVNYSTGCAQLDEANFSLCPTTIPPNASNGNIYARACAGPDWQGGEGVYQNVSGLTIGQLYTVSFDYAGSNLYGGSDSVRWKVFIDDTLVTQTPFFSSSKNTWSMYSVNFVATQSVHKIGLRAYFINPSVTGDGSAGLDNIILSWNAEQTGLEDEMENSFVEIYPKLMGNYVSLKSKLNEEIEVSLYDINSKVMLSGKFYRNISLNVENLAPGVYFCLIRSKRNMVSRQTLMKR